MKTENVIEKVEKYHFGEKPKNIKWANEVSMGVGGSIDCVMAKRKNYEGLTGGIEDFVCVEYQASGTTGSPYQAIKEFKENGEFQSKKYDYGINWANGMCSGSRINLQAFCFFSGKKANLIF